ncbi:MAG TPA: SBBP repeat-containing protein, partial [candidate division Zixibacteria bacterium]|nr:SBBP repeat-containing protein [candidate division Zixibacteria bacterium]
MRIRRSVFLLFPLLSYLPVLAQVEEAWVSRYDCPPHSFDIANVLAVDINGNVYVTGLSFGSNNCDEAAIIKYSPDGDFLWVRGYGPQNCLNETYAIGVDDSGNVYVTGESCADILTIKYSPNGDTSWIKYYNGPADYFDLARTLAVDKDRNVYVAGYSFGTLTSADFTTIKYAPNGDTIWIRRYNKGGATDLVVDMDGNAHVTGIGYDSTSLYDFLTIKYKINGDTSWARRYNGPTNSRDEPNAI